MFLGCRGRVRSRKKGTCVRKREWWGVGLQGQMSGVESTGKAVGMSGEDGTFRASVRKQKTNLKKKHSSL